MPKIKCYCAYCKNVLYKYLSIINTSKSGRVFCNSKCRGLYNRSKKIKCNCAYCGKIIEKTQRQLKHTQKYNKSGLIFCNKSCCGKYRFKDPIYVKKMSDNTKKCWKDSEYRNIITESARKTMIKRRSDPNETKKMDDQLKKLNEFQWSNSDFVKMMSGMMKNLWKDPEFYQTQVDKMNRLWKDENFSNKVRNIASNMMAERWKNKDYIYMKSNQMRNMVINLWNNEDHRQFMQELGSKNWEDYNYRLKQCESHVGGFIPQNIIYRDYKLETEIRTSPENKQWIDKIRKQTGDKDFFINKSGIIEVHHIIEFQTIIDIMDIHNIEDAKNCNLLWDIDNGLPMLKQYHKPLFNKLLKEKFGENIKASEFTEEDKKYVREIIYPQIINRG
jgi:hypothetical protein